MGLVMKYVIGLLCVLLVLAYIKWWPDTFDIEEWWNKEE